MIAQRAHVVFSAAAILFVLAGGTAQSLEAGGRIDVGASGDERFLVEGFYGPEGPNSSSKMPLAAVESFRWASNRFVIRLPVVPGRHNEVTLRAHFSGPMIVAVGNGWRSVVTGAGTDSEEAVFVLPADIVGESQELVVECRAMYPRPPGATDKRNLFLLLSEIRIRPLDELPQAARLDAVALPPSPEDHRDCLRNVERRPPVSDPAAYAELLAAERANVVTLGTMNGRGLVFFPTDLAAVDPRMDPDYLPVVIRELQRRGLHVMSWVVFNVQDIRDPDDFEPIKRFPEWQMRYIDEPGAGHKPRVGMCLVSSPYVEHHAKVLQQAAAFDIDGFFFDGFYFGGIPHPARPGCVCTFCRKMFRDETSLELPTEVDWTSGTFKRWVRWRNDRLLAVARYFQEEIRRVNPKATCTFNTNLWPFGNKDWETAIPMWRIEGIGVSQHAYSSRYHEKWMMLGFKARLGRDVNPEHTDMWRAAGLSHTCGVKTPDWAWHELEMLTFVLAGPTYGITPWHSTIEGPVEITARIHTAAALREPYFSRQYVCDVGVVCSQNTHDFYGHLPETENLADYRDGLIGTWMLLTENHIPFEFVFDNQLDRQNLQNYRTLILANTAALSEEQARAIVEWKQNGGRLITTADTGRFDEWGRVRKATLLAGEADVHWQRDPGLAYCRKRDESATALVRAIRKRTMPLEVEAPPSLVANLFANPKDPEQRWIHLLNVSHLMPAGDAGFRGIGRDPAPRQAPVGAAAAGFGSPLIPAKNIRLRIRDQHAATARLAIANEPLAIDAEGWITVPGIELHDVVVVETRQTEAGIAETVCGKHSPGRRDN